MDTLVVGLVAAAETMSKAPIAPPLNGNGCGCADCVAHKEKESLPKMAERRVEAQRLAEAAAAKVREKEAKVAEMVQRKAQRDAHRAETFLPCSQCKKGTRNDRLYGCTKCDNWLCNMCTGVAGGKLLQARNDKTWTCPNCASS